MHPCAAAELLVDPLPEGADREGALYPDGAHLTDLKEVRGLLYKMQRPAIAPGLVYPHDWYVSLICNENITCRSADSLSSFQPQHNCYGLG